MLNEQRINVTQSLQMNRIISGPAESTKLNFPLMLLTGFDVGAKYCHNRSQT